MADGPKIDLDKTENTTENIEKVEKTQNTEDIQTKKIDEGLLSHVKKMGILDDVSISLKVEIGRAQIKIKDLLSLTKGSVVELNKLAGEPVDIYANGKIIATGTIIMANDKYGIRFSSINIDSGS